LLEYFNKIWDEYWHDKVFIVKDDYSAENYGAMGRKFIEDYYDHYKPFDDIRTITIETVDFFPLDNGIEGIRICGANLGSILRFLEAIIKCFVKSYKIFISIPRKNFLFSFQDFLSLQIPSITTLLQ